eukprot:gb/GFBE01057323.1/.p1 GENE.gb/GFBE01057323.1/~~gb/GFBE01057323.1/.p1  ORF type:complete len:317 (+),score=53.04 gb/GFBE01057323.1/:1-951(+)
MIAGVRGFFETCTDPLGSCCAQSMGCSHFEFSEELPEENELGTKDDLLRGLAMVARLCYGSGFVDRETWGFYDPPLNGEGWKVIDQICETMHSQDAIQAACYVREGNTYGMGIVAYRGTVSFKGLCQDIALGLPVARHAIRKAVREACSFYHRCQARFPNLHLYVTGHSLGGYIAEAVASYMDADGAVFNSPGPWSVNPLKNSAGKNRPYFEVHLTRDDPLSFAVFPKPENSHHICEPIWHEGNNHRICKPYMKEIDDMQGVKPNTLPMDTRQRVDQIDALELDYPPPSEIDETFGIFHNHSGDLDSETESESGRC